MTFDRAEWQEKRAAREVSALRQKRPELELLQQAEVSAQALTGIPEWDTYLRYLQAAIDRSVTQRQQWLAKMTQPDATDDEVSRMRRYVIMLDAQINAWHAVMALPGDIMKQGEAAEDLLSRVRALDGA